MPSTPRRRRPIRVATVSHRPASAADTPEGLDRLMSAAETLLGRAARMGADLVAFPECYPQLASSDPWHHPEPAGSGSLDRAREAARKHNLYIVWPRIEYDPDRGLRNTSILVDRSGEVVGRYDKMFPTVTELEKGAVPGTEAPCYETDFGRVGLLICFDLNFPEVRAALAGGRPDVVVFSSMYRGGLQARALAFELRSYVVTAISAELGQVIDRCGRVLKESTYEALAVAPINTNSVALHMDGNWQRMDEILAEHGPGLDFDYHTREAFVVLESTADRDVDALVDRLGLERADSYFDRSRRERLAALDRFRSKGGGAGR